jgi:adenine-specific DNA-methyltransferase
VSKPETLEYGGLIFDLGDENIHLVRSLLDEVFGSENAISTISVRKTGGTTGDFLAGTTDFVLWYARQKPQCKYHPLFVQRSLADAFESGYDYIQTSEGERRRATAKDLDGINRGSVAAQLWLNQILTSPRIRENRTGYFPVEFEGRTYLPTAGEWKTNRDGMKRLIIANRIVSNGSSLGYVRLANDFPAVALNNLWSDMWGANRPVYVVQTATRLVERCILMTTDPGDLVLDPTCGSGTTAFVAEQWGRRWITVGVHGILTIS